MDRKIQFHTLNFISQYKGNFVPLGQYYFYRAINTIFCHYHSLFSLSPISRDVETEAAESVKFLWKRKLKHFDERDWKRKRTQKPLILYGAGSGSKKFQR